MKLDHKIRLVLSLAAVAAATAAGGAFAAGDVLKSSNLDQISGWYGRAGGLVGSDRISALSGTYVNPHVGVTYDKAVAARTNMALDRPEGGSIQITQDKDLRARTNMGVGFEDKASTQAVAKKQ